MDNASRKRKDRTPNYKGNFVNKHQILNQNRNQYQYQYQSPNKNNITSFRNTTSYPGSPKLFPASGQAPSNRILAGYMAHEYLTKGTLFGQKFDPARAEAVPISAAEPSIKPGLGEPAGSKMNRSYAEVAQILMRGDGTHIPGIVNPTQLARWIQM